MALELYFHPLASFCHKVLIAFYEHDIALEPVIVDLGDEASRAAFAAVWPLLKFPILRDRERNCTVAESATIIEFIDAFHAADASLIPKNPDAAWRVRMWDRIFDQYVQTPMQKIVTDNIRPDGGRDPHGVADAQAQLRDAYRFLEDRLHPAPWLTGATFTMADCSAAPALYYANTVLPFAKDSQLRAYLKRLMRRRSFARVLAEAEPYFDLFPMPQKPTSDPSAI